MCLTTMVLSRWVRAQRHGWSLGIARLSMRELQVMFCRMFENVHALYKRQSAAEDKFFSLETRKDPFTPLRHLLYPSLTEYPQAIDRANMIMAKEPMENFGHEVEALHVTHGGE